MKKREWFYSVAAVDLFTSGDSLLYGGKKCDAVTMVYFENFKLK